MTAIPEDFIAHRPGDPRPVGPRVKVEVIMNDDPADIIGPIEAFDIDWFEMGDDVTAYRVVKDTK